MNRQQKVVLAVSILASFVAFLDGAIVNVALPAISRNLGGGLTAQQWIVDAYLLMLGSFILIAGSLSDLIGRNRILSFGLAGFGLASVLCALSPNSDLLIVFRSMQGIAGAMLVPSSLALIISNFSGAAQGKAIGTWTAWTGISFIVGPLLGGLIINYASWRWIFAINVVPIAVTLYLLTKIKNSKPTKAASVDIKGAVLCALGLGGPVFALIEQPDYGWGSPRIYLSLIVGVLLLIGFVFYENRIEHPMLPLSLFRNRNFSVGNVATLAIYAGLTASTFLIIVFLQQVEGYSALAAGVSLLPVTIIMFFLSQKSGYLAGRFGPRLFMGLGPIIAGVGFLMLLRIGNDASYWTRIFPGIIVFGIGLVTTVAPLTAAILADVPSKQAGIASAVNNAVARVAGLLAVAAVGAIVAVQFGSSLDHNSYLRSAASSSVNKSKHEPLIITPPKPYTGNTYYRLALKDASISGFHSGLIAITVLVMGGGVISLIGIKNPPKNEIHV